MWAELLGRMLPGALARANFHGGPGTGPQARLRPPAQRLRPRRARNIIVCGCRRLRLRPRLLRDGWVHVQGVPVLILRLVEGVINMSLVHCVVPGVCAGGVCVVCVPGVWYACLRIFCVVRNISVHWPTVYDFLGTYNSLPWGDGGGNFLGLSFASGGYRVP